MTCTSTTFDKEGLPAELITDDDELKVTLGDESDDINSNIRELLDVNKSILLELKLLNIRFEEMADTNINKTDIEE